MRKKKSPPRPGFTPRVCILAEMPPGVEDFRARCPVPKDFRVDPEHLCRSTLSEFAPIRTLLPGIAQSVELFTEVVRGAPGASGHLAQRDRRMWVFPVGRTLPLLFGGSSAVGTGQAYPRSLLLLLSLLPELLLVDLVHVSCVVCAFFFSCFPPGVDVMSRGNAEKKNRFPPLSDFPSPRGMH